MLTLNDFDPRLIAKLSDENSFNINNYLKKIVTQPDAELEMVKCLIIAILKNEIWLVALIHELKQIDASKYYPGLGIPFHYAILQQNNDSIEELLLHTRGALVNVRIPEVGNLNMFEIALQNKQYRFIASYMRAHLLSFLNQDNFAKFFALVDEQLKFEKNTFSGYFLELKDIQKIEFEIQSFFRLLVNLPQPELIIEIINLTRNFITNEAIENEIEIPNVLLKRMTNEHVKSLKEFIFLIREKGNVHVFHKVGPQASFWSNNFFNSSWSNYREYVVDKSSVIISQVYSCNKEFINTLHTWKATRESNFLKLEIDREMMIFSDKKITNTSELIIKSILIDHNHKVIGIFRNEISQSDSYYNEDLIHPSISFDDSGTAFVYNDDGLAWVSLVVERKNQLLAYILRLEWAVIHRNEDKIMDICQKIENNFKDLLLNRNQQQLIKSYLMQLRSSLLKQEIILPKNAELAIENLYKLVATPTLKEYAVSFYIQNNFINLASAANKKIPPSLQMEIEASYLQTESNQCRPFRH